MSLRADRPSNCVLPHLIPLRGDPVPGYIEPMSNVMKPITDQLLEMSLGADRTADCILPHLVPLGSNPMPNYVKYMSNIMHSRQEVLLNIIGEISQGRDTIEYKYS